MKILITAIGCPVFNTVHNCIRSLFENIEIYGCDIVQNSNSKMVDNFFIVPKGNNREYTETILDNCLKNKITHVIPMSDEEIISIGVNLEKFKKNKIKIFGESRIDIINVFNKSSLYNLMQTQNLNVSPIFRHIKNSNDFFNAFSYFESINRKMCVKPNLSHGSRGFAIIEKITYEEYLNSKTIKKITCEQFLDIIGNKKVDLVATEYLPGEEYSVDCVMFNENFYCIIRSRDETINGISSKCTIKNIKSLEVVAREIYEKLKFNYLVNIQFKRDTNNNFKLLEVNPRIPGGIGFSVLAGVDLLKMSFSKFFNLKNVNMRSKPEYAKTIEKKWKLIKY